MKQITASFCICVIMAVLQKLTDAEMLSTYTTAALKSAPVAIHGLSNCSYVYMKPVTQFENEWKWMFWDINADTIRSINAPQGSIHISSYSNGIDQLISHIHQNTTTKIYTTDLSRNISYQPLIFEQYSFAFYNLSYQTFLVGTPPGGSLYHKIYTGNIKMNTFIEIFEYPPSLLTPTKDIKCSGYCLWLMDNGLLFNYPTQDTARLTGLQSQKIIHFDFAIHSSGQKYIYTAMQSGIVVEWVSVTSQWGKFEPSRINYNHYGRSIGNAHVVGVQGNNFYFISDDSNNISVIDIENNELIEYSNNFMGNDNNFTQNYCYNTPHIYLSKRGVNQSSNILHQKLLHGPSSSIKSGTKMLDIVCNTSVSANIEINPGENGIKNQWYCYLEQTTMKYISGWVQQAKVVDYCVKYKMVGFRCLQCSNDSVLNQSDLCEMSDSEDTEGSVDVKNLPQGGKQSLQILTVTADFFQTPFFFVKNLLQLTLFAIILHNMISFWGLASIYYFLPNSADFLRNILLLMWKTYNISVFSMLGLSQPILPKLNEQPSTLIYGQVTISNDILQFTLDPMMILLFTLLNAIIFHCFRKYLQYKCMNKLKLSWLKTNIFQSTSSILIELLPILFLPSANLLFQPHFNNMKQKINLLIFSTLGAIGLIFPFIYLLKILKIKKNVNNNIIKGKNKQIHDFLCCVLHITLPILVLANRLLFLVFNGVIYVGLIVNAFYLKKQKINTIIHRVYYLLYHMCFFVMEYCQVGRVFSLAGLIATAIIVVYLVHQVLEFCYKAIRYVMRIYADCKKSAKIENQFEEEGKKKKYEVDIQDMEGGLMKQDEKGCFNNDEKVNQRVYEDLFPYAYALTSVVNLRKERVINRRKNTRRRDTSELEQQDLPLQKENIPLSSHDKPPSQSNPIETQNNEQTDSLKGEDVTMTAFTRALTAIVDLRLRKRRQKRPNYHENNHQPQNIDL